MKQKLSPFSVITIFIALALVGISFVPLLNIQLKPSPSPTSITVSFSWSEASAKVIEQEVTSVLEGVFNSIKEVEEISSTTRKGRGNIRIQFKKGTNMDAVRFEMANLIRQSYPNLPERVSYPYLSMRVASESNKPILSYSINANESPYFIKKYTEKHIVPELAMIDGVSRVSVYGASAYEWVITYNSDKLYQLQLSVNEVAQAINTFLGESELGRAKIMPLNSSTAHEISVKLLYKVADDFNWGEIPIRKVNHQIIYLKDIAKVRFQEGQVNAYYRINGLNTINLVLYPEKGENRIALANRLKKRIDALKSELEVGYQLKLTNDSTEFLLKELSKIERRSLFSLGILLLLTIALYRNIKCIIILFSSLVVTLLLAAIFYYFIGIELQLYSLAGITISFGIIIDNTIIMMDHLRTKGDKKAFLAILAATLTTIGAISIIFLLNENQQANLADFASVIAINLGISLLVAYFLVPAMMQQLRFDKKKKKIALKGNRKTIKITQVYSKYINISKKPIVKFCLIVGLIFAFGIPLHLTPKDIKGKGFWVETYNSTLGNESFTSSIRPTLEKVIGGTFRLFTENIFKKSFYQEPQRTSLNIRGSMPDGSTIEQLNKAVKKIERYLSSFKEVALFETSIYSYRNSTISVYFKEEYENSGFPFVLKSLLETKVNMLGGMDWSITGVGRGFSNAIQNNSKSDRIVLHGYNYDELYRYAEILKETLINKANGRITAVEIKSERSWYSSVLFEYFLDFDPKLMALAEVNQAVLYNAIKNQLHSGRLQSVINDGELQQVKLISDQYTKTNVWDLKNAPINIDGKQYKLKQLVNIEKKKSGNSIKKHNQNYQLNVAFNFIGPRPLARTFKKKRIEELASILPIGYTVQVPSYSYWNKSEQTQYYYILVVILIIFFICSILLESLKQPFAVITMIPISFIGLFLTFYWFEFNFDQGGYAAFILLSGISVNAALYVVNEYNNLKKEYPNRSNQQLYLKAYNHKIIPILLTILSTIAGLIPFVWSGQQDVFWFSFAIGSIGGLLFSLIGIILFLPMLSIKKDKV